MGHYNEGRRGRTRRCDQRHRLEHIQPLRVVSLGSFGIDSANAENAASLLYSKSASVDAGDGRNAASTSAEFLARRNLSIDGLGDWFADLCPTVDLESSTPLSKGSSPNDTPFPNLRTVVVADIDHEKHQDTPARRCLGNLLPGSQNRAVPQKDDGEHDGIASSVEDRHLASSENMEVLLTTAALLWRPKSICWTEPVCAWEGFNLGSQTFHHVPYPVDRNTIHYAARHMPTAFDWRAAFVLESLNIIIVPNQCLFDDAFEALGDFFRTCIDRKTSISGTRFHIYGSFAESDLALDESEEASDELMWQMLKWKLEVVVDEKDMIRCCSQIECRDIANMEPCPSCGRYEYGETSKE